MDHAAAVKQHWASSLDSLKAITAAAAAEATPQQQLQHLAASAGTVCLQAIKQTLPGAEQQGFASDARTRKVLVDELKVPLQLAQAISTLLTNPSTAHAAAALSQQLSTLLAALEPALLALRPPTVGDKHMKLPGNGLAIAAQLSASGLLHQLPAALHHAQKQLSQLQHTTGAASNTSASPTAAAGGEAGNGEGVGLQANLLGLSAQLISFWPKGALESSALGPSLIPAAELALASLQCASKLAAQHSSSSDAPPPAVAALGKSALSVCCMLCGAAACLMYSSPEVLDHGNATMPRYAQTVLAHPAMLAAMVAAVACGMYGELVSDMLTAGAQQQGNGGASSNSSHGSSIGGSVDSLGPLTVQQQQQVEVDSTADLATAVWDLLSAQEGQVKAGQALVPPLQQQLVESLGCSSKGFLWVSALWASDAACGLAGDLQVQQLLMLAVQVHFMVELAQLNPAGMKQPVPAKVLLQLSLMPALMLRFALHKQQISAATGVQSAWHPMLGARVGMESLLMWTKLSEKVIEHQKRQPKQKQAGDQPVGELPAALLHELLQLLLQMLKTALQAPSSTSSSAAGGGSKSSSIWASSSWHFPDESAFDSRTPAVVVASLAGYIATLLVNATPAVVGASVPTTVRELREEALASAVAELSGRSKSSSRVDCYSDEQPGDSSSGAGNSTGDSGSGSGSTAATDNDWLLLLQDMVPVLQRSMRYEAQHGPSQPDMDHRWQGMYKDVPQGPTWTAAHLLASCADHAVFDIYIPSQDGTAPKEKGLSERDPPPSLFDLAIEDDLRYKGKALDVKPGDKPSLLLWLLDRAPVEQQAAVRQEVLELLCTMLRLSKRPQTPHQLVTVSNCHKGVMRVVWEVLQQLQDCELLSGGDVGNSSSAARGAEGDSSSTVQREGCAYAPWLGLLGRVFLQSAQLLSATRQYVQHALSTPQGAFSDRGDLVKTVINAMRLPDMVLPVGVKYAAVMFATDSSKQLPVNKPHSGPGGFGEQILAPDNVKISAQKRREMQEVGHQVAEYCNCAGMGVSKLQDSTWALAEAHAAVATYFFQAMASLGMAAYTSFPGNQSGMPTDHQVIMMQSWGVPESLARQTTQAVFRGASCSMQDLLLAAFTVQPAVTAYLQRLAAAGQALCSLPTAAVCNNSKCSNLSGSSEGEVVGGQASRCSGCKLVKYCGITCQKEHWDVHKRVCKAVRAKRAAA